MTIQVLTGEEAAEYMRTYEQHVAATAYAFNVLCEKGMGSTEYIEAESAVTRLWQRLRELRGDAGKPWEAM
jgi:hypothetical protein